MRQEARDGEEHSTGKGGSVSPNTILHMDKYEVNYVIHTSPGRDFGELNGVKCFQFVLPLLGRSMWGVMGIWWMGRVNKNG